MPEAQINSYTSESVLSDEERQHRIEELRKMIEGNYYAAFKYTKKMYGNEL